MSQTVDVICTCALTNCTAFPAAADHDHTRCALLPGMCTYGPYHIKREYQSWSLGLLPSQIVIRFSRRAYDGHSSKHSVGAGCNLISHTACSIVCVCMRPFIIHCTYSVLPANCSNYVMKKLLACSDSSYVDVLTDTHMHIHTRCPVFRWEHLPMSTQVVQC